MKIILINICLSVIFSSFGQELRSKKEVSDVDNKSKIEFFILPGIIFNHANMGLSYRSSPIFEHNLSFSTYYELIGRNSINLNLSYSLNSYFNNRKDYMPIWFRVSNTRNEVGYEDGYHPHTLRYSLGTGYGRIFNISKKWGLRTELGMGVGLNVTNSDGKMLSMDLNLNEFKRDEYHPEQNPYFISTFRFKLAFIRKLR